MTLHSEAVKEIDLEALRAALDYFSQRQDAEYHTDSPTATPNEEMRHAVTLGAVFSELTTRRARDEDVAELVKAVVESREALQEFANDGWLENWTRHVDAEVALDAALLPFQHSDDKGDAT